MICEGEESSYEIGLPLRAERCLGNLACVKLSIRSSVSGSISGATYLCVGLGWDIFDEGGYLTDAAGGLLRFRGLSLTGGLTFTGASSL